MRRCTVGTGRAGLWYDPGLCPGCMVAPRGCADECVSPLPRDPPRWVPGRRLSPLWSEDRTAGSLAVRVLVAGAESVPVVTAARGSESRPPPRGRRRPLGRLRRPGVLLPSRSDGLPAAAPAVHLALPGPNGTRASRSVSLRGPAGAPHRVWPTRPRGGSLERSGHPQHRHARGPRGVAASAGPRAPAVPRAVPRAVLGAVLGAVHGASRLCVVPRALVAGLAG